MFVRVLVLLVLVLRYFCNLRMPLRSGFGRLLRRPAKAEAAKAARGHHRENRGGPTHAERCLVRVVAVVGEAVPIVPEVVRVRLRVGDLGVLGYVLAQRDHGVKSDARENESVKFSGRARNAEGAVGPRGADSGGAG